MKKISNILLALVITLTVVSCKEKDPETPATTTGDAKFEFEHVFGTEAFELNSVDFYTTGNGDNVKFTTLKYYISNIKLKKTDGTIWKQPNSYYLLDLSDETSTLIKISDIPTGDYKEITFTIGVDSTRNVSGAQTGALSTTKGMFWSWSSGYIFLKAEGSWENSPNSGNFMFHVGGFKNSNNTNAIQTRTISFGSYLLSVKQDGTPQAHMSVDVSKIFTGTGVNVDLNTLNTIHMPGANAINVSENYVDMFELEHIHN